MGQAIISVYNNPKYYEALGKVAVNIEFLKAGWLFIYFNTLDMTWDGEMDDMGFREVIRMIRKTIHIKVFVNLEAKKKLLALADISVELNRKRNYKLHASVLGGAGEFYIREKTMDGGISMETLDDNKIKEIVDIVDEIAEHGRIVHEIIYEKEYYKLIEHAEQNTLDSSILSSN